MAWHGVLVYSRRDFWRLTSMHRHMMPSPEQTKGDGNSVYI